MRTIFFAPRDEPSPVRPDQVIAGSLVVGRFLGNVETPAFIGWAFEVTPVPGGVPRRSTIDQPASQWNDVGIGV